MDKGPSLDLSTMRKDSLMFGLIVFLWLCAAFYFTPRILALLIGPENILAKFSIILFALLLNLFWFYGFYHLIIILFSYSKDTDNLGRSNEDKRSDEQNNPSVALLYTTCNDFKEEAVLSCFNQDYSNFHTFILDDSNEKGYKRRIDDLALKYKGKITVIRRPDRKGYKAGNINYGLSKIKGFEYFNISDADTILPKDYILRLLPYFNKPNVAFVQARQELNPNQNSSFAQELGFQIGLHYDHYLRTKNTYGFVMFYGHGALMRYDIWKEIGGFPEVATEDLAYSMKVRERGYFGVYVQDVVCYEDYPPTYQQYRRRNEKWIRGTAECLFKFYPSFLKSRRISWVEKFDVLASASSLLLAFPFLLLLLLVGFVLPFFFYHFRFQGPMFRMPIIFDSSLLNLAVGIKGNLFWRWDFFLMLLLALVSPILPAIVQIFKRPGKRLRYIVMYTFVFYAMQLVSALNLIAYLLTRKATFSITGQEREDLKDSGGGPLGFFSRPVSNHKAVVFMEAVSAALFFLISLSTQNIWFLSFGVGLIISVFLFNLGFENKLLKALVGIPLIITVIVVLFIGKTLQ